ncbi:MAG: hypothetical protein JRF07_05185 [Deltaproteobacteria bacterium]|jgi:hypothetical protein|nr:hypothetical protein [Deltaproteobacteria bacterium]MBW2477658.1 hypothetical protein [Deltaproteobacteria bacterium]MBW2520270.1 hypothetical protein [Deltaproteobacteria bacterium]
MNDIQTYVIRRAFVFPLGLLIGLVVLLLVTCLVQKQPVAKPIILGFLSVPLVTLFFESVARRIEISAEGVTARRTLRTMKIPFNQVTGLEAVKVRSRVFITLMAGEDDYLIISNSYSHFPKMLKQLIAALPSNVVSEETRQLANQPTTRQADIVAVWFAVAALIYILLAQFGVA